MSLTETVITKHRLSRVGISHDISDEGVRELFGVQVDVVSSFSTRVPSGAIPQVLLCGM